MLRPERMSRVSVAGSRAVLADVIETVHDLEVLHLSEYDDDIQGFDPGSPLEGADDAARKLVTVRALLSTLEVDPEETGPARIDPTGLDDRLEEIRTEANALDDRREQLEQRRRELESTYERAAHFVDLGIDLDLLGGYEHLSTAVGPGDADAIRSTLADHDAVEAFEVFTGEETVGVFASLTEGDLEDVLVGVAFEALAVPDADRDPTTFLQECRHELRQVQSELRTVESKLDRLALDVGGDLLAAEEFLTTEVDKREAPLSFATTERAFVAEGWLPTAELDQFESVLREAVGDRIAIDELERAEYDEGHPVDRDPATPERPEAADGTDGDDRIRADGGVLALGDPDPPVVQDNPSVARPFEPFVSAVGVPNYDELDPTVLVWLTFPAFFGFMIGDLGYGLLYAAIGWAVIRRFESPGIRSMGGVGLWAGAFTALFGLLYGEVFGTHLVTAVLWDGLLGLGGSPLHKGFIPAHSEWALFWLVGSLLAGLLHLTIGYLVGFVDDMTHGVWEAITENASWLAMLLGIWAWIFSFHGAAFKPPFMVGEAAVLNGHPVPLGFAGLPAIVGIAGILLFAVGFVLLGLGEPIELIEFLDVFVNVISYVRLMAVLLAKAGMAFVVNLFVFGVGATDGGEWHFLITETPQHFLDHHEGAEILFGGLFHGGFVGILGGLIILLGGHLVVMVLGVVSGGLQAVRLEYVEFFGKFYTGNGRAYRPFGTRQSN
ncbi:MAG: V-type ATP synthase subunit I [Halococcoides sp.]